MFQKVKQFRIFIVYALLILLASNALNSHRKAEHELVWTDRFVLFLTSPLQATVTFTMRSINEFVQNYIFLVQTKNENKFLLQQNRILHSTVANLKEIGNENKRLRDILDFEKAFPFKKVIAQVIGRDAYPDFRTIRINKGTEDGLKNGMPVVTHEGIVGRIIRVAGSVADVLTILDNQSAADSLIQRSRTRGIVEGISDTFCQMKYTLRTDQIEIGDQIITSGLGGVFPKGVNLGIVTRVEKKSYGVTQNVELKPSVDFSKLEEVIVLLNINSKKNEKLTFNETVKSK